MSRHDWKPGAVALIEAGCHANRKVAIRTGVPSNMGWAYSDTHDGESTQSWTADTHGTVSVVRPLVVIDPEDREQAKRLLSTWWDRLGGFGAGGPSEGIDNMQAALRSLTEPPKPAVYEHVIAVQVANGSTRSLCGKVWQPQPDAVQIVGRCPECAELAGRWIA